MKHILVGIANHHHFTTNYHINIVMPLLNDLFSFGYDINALCINNKIINGFDVSLPVPKVPMIFDVISYADNETLSNVSYDEFIYCGNGKYGQETDYHKIYRYGHRSSKIINKTIDNNRKLLISGDSQMIPSIPILSMYFKEVYYFDNRDGLSHFEKDIQYTDILFAIGYNNFNKYIYNLI